LHMSISVIDMLHEYFGFTLIEQNNDNQFQNIT
jgi:hypothetical protein